MRRSNQGEDEMTDREAMTLALEALESNSYGNTWIGEISRNAIAALRQALEQSEQPYKGIADRMYRETNGRMRIDPVTGDVGIGSPSEPPEQPQFFYGQDPNVLPTHGKGAVNE
jgi:hypothetical protein